MHTPIERLKREIGERRWSPRNDALHNGRSDAALVSMWKPGTIQGGQGPCEHLCSLFDKVIRELDVLTTSKQGEPTTGTSGTSHERTRQQLTHVSLGSRGTLFPFSRTEIPLVRRDWLLSFVGTLLILLGLIAGTLLAYAQNKLHQQHKVGQTVLGELSFASSGQVNDLSNQGTADEVKIALRPLAPLVTGTGYYAWLLPDQDHPEDPVVLLGQLVNQSGEGTLLYRDPQHRNLLATFSQLLITSQPISSPPPSFPTVENANWHYVASIPQLPARGQQYSLLDHLRHLLSNDPDLQQRGLSGGLTIWFYRDVQEVLACSISAQHQWQETETVHTRFMQTQVIRILNMLDGTTMQRPDSPKVPVLVDAHTGSVALLQFDPAQRPPGYLEHIPLHIRGVISSPGASASQQVLADQLLTALYHVQTWLDAVYSDAVQLATMSQTQLTGQLAKALLTDMETNASSAFAGQADPMTGNLQGGTQWLFQHIPDLATMQITSYQV